MSLKNSALEGLTVIDLANEFGVYCGKLLAAMGADVIKVEKPGGDLTRKIGPFFKDNSHPEKSLFFAYENTGKKSVTLNLEVKDGQEIFRKMAKNSDVVIETFRVGYMDSLGLGYSSLKEDNPGLIMTSITPFGQNGSHKNWNACSEIVPWAMGGTMFLTGEPFMPPLQIGNFLLGHLASSFAVLGILAALHNRWFTEEGTQVDISMQDTAISCQDTAFSAYQTPPYMILKRLGSMAYLRVPSQIYPCRDGYFYIAGFGRWNLMVAWLVDEGIDVGDLVDPKYDTAGPSYLLWEALDKVYKVICELGMKYNKQELMFEGQKRGIPVTMVSTAKEVYESPHYKARDYFIEVEHPVIGKLKYPGVPVKMTRSPWQVDSPAPLIGQHNQEVYSKLGFSKKDLTILKTRGVI